MDASEPTQPLHWHDAVRERAEMFGLPMPTDEEMSTWVGFIILCERPDCGAFYWVPAFLEHNADRYAISNGWRRKGQHGAFWYCPQHTSFLDANKWR